MDILGYLLDALTPFNLGLALAGVILGTVIGALPGLSATMAVAVLVPFTFTMAPASGLIALGAIYTGAIYGGAFAAILVNTPGTPSSIATTFDGYPMAKRGDGGLAITLATVSSVFGGFVGGVFLLLLAPPLAKVALAFGPPEYFWLAMFGLTLISALSVGNTIKGLIGGCFGLLLSMVGVAVVGGDIRFTMNTQALLGGFDIVSALIGLYCIPVIIDLVATRDRHLQIESEARGLRFGEAVRIALSNKINLVRSSVLGTVIGILPGAGGSIAGLVSYSEARRTSKHPERFGTGEPNGVIATETANNATVGGGFIPTLVLGIPGTPPDAIILGALLVQGIKIGPTLFSQQGEIVYTFIFGLLIATVLMLPAGLLIGRYAYKSIAAIPKSMLVPTIAFLTVIGSFAIHNSLHDVQVMLALGVVGWILDRYGFQPSPIVLGLVLGQIAEQGFVQSYLIGNAQHNLVGMYFGRPISIAIIAAGLLTLLYPLLAWRRKAAPAAAAPGASAPAPKPVGLLRSPRDLPGMLIALALAAVAIWAFVQTFEMTALGSVFPRTISIALVLFSAVLIVINILRRPGAREVRDNGSAVRRIAVVVVMALWVAAIPLLGFATAALVAFLLLIVVAAYERMSPRTIAIHVVSAAVIVTCFYLLMADVLLIRLPTGLFI